MQVARITGQGASALKYDILTALSLVGMHGSPLQQTSMMRLMSLITARYDWRKDQLTVGQVEMARMWGVDPRTVKREIKRLTETKFLICKRAGVKGRVASYRLNLPHIFQISEPNWAKVGSDYAGRMSEQSPIRSETVVQVDFTQGIHSGHVDEDQAHPKGWSRARSRIAKLHPSHYRHWIAGLRFVHDEAGRYRLTAPSAFVARYVQTHLVGILQEAVEAEIGPGRKIEIVEGQGA